MSDPRLLWHAYRDGELSEAQARELVAAIRVQPQLLADWQLEAELSVALDPVPQGLGRMLRVRLERKALRVAPGRHAGRGVGRGVGGQRRRSRSRRSPAAAIIVLVVAALAIALGIALMRPGPVAPADADTPVVAARAVLAEVISGCGVPVGSAVHADEVCTGTGRIRFPDGSELALQSASLRLRQTAGALIDLSGGTVIAAVQPQAPGTQWTVRTSHGEVRVVGTRFTVARQHDRTGVEVEEGTVNVLTSSVQRTLQAGDQVDLLSNGEIAAAAEAVDLLASGMSALQTMRGSWEMVNGELHGRGDAANRCRIRTAAVFPHGEVEVEVRGQDAVLFEVQIRGYAAFVMVEFGDSAAWHQVRVRFDADQVRATADGREVPVELVADEADGEPFVSMYAQVNPGGFVAIRRWQVIPQE